MISSNETRGAVTFGQDAKTNATKKWKLIFYHLFNDGSTNLVQLEASGKKVLTHGRHLLHHCVKNIIGTTKNTIKHLGYL